MELPQEPERNRAVFADRADPDRKRGPFADTVGRQDGRAARGRGQERRGRVRLVMFGKQDAAGADAELRRDDAPDPELSA